MHEKNFIFYLQLKLRLHLEKTNEIPKGGLISESFLFWLQSPKKGAKSLSWASSLYVESTQLSNLGTFFGAFGKNEKHSEIIKPPLMVRTAVEKLINFRHSNQVKNVPEIASHISVAYTL